MQITETRDGLGGMVPLCTRSSSLRRRDPDQVLRVTASPVERDQRNLSPLSGPPLERDHSEACSAEGQRLPHVKPAPTEHSVLYCRQ